MRFVLLACLVACACAPTVGGREPVSPTHRALSTGAAEGVTADGVTAWRGIRYATAGRWQAAMPVSGGEPILADHFGPACPQDGQEQMVEDCLYLNVWAPAGAGPGDALPVMVHVHGGGMRSGSGEITPEGLVRRGVIVVSFNYRLGNLGFFDYPLWGPDDLRNFALDDMVTALEWVDDNIEAFGGDRDRVTIAGHSAGGANVQQQLLLPEARGLFDQAISRAGYAYTWPFREAANLSDDQIAVIRVASLDSLRALPAADIVAQTPFFTMPWTGGPTLPDAPAEMIAAGQLAPVPLITGGNSYDGAGVLYGTGLTPASWLALWGDWQDEIETLYAEDFAVSEAQAAQRLFGDARYVANAQATAAAHAAHGNAAWLYFYDAPMPGQPGAPHGAETGQIFSDAPTPMQDYWVSFLENGDPAVVGLPDWQEAGTDAPSWMVFTPDPAPSDEVLAERLALIERAWPTVYRRLQEQGAP